MKKFTLDLSKYEVKVMQPVEDEDGEVIGTEPVMEIYPLRENLSAWLRSPGIFKAGEELVEAVVLGKRLSVAQEDLAVLDGREAEILKKAINVHLNATSQGRGNLGGPIHEEAILRIFSMEEAK